MNTEHTVNDHEMLSALADGQLRGAAFAQAVESVLQDDEARATWHCYQVIGDVLRSGDLASQCSGDGAFLARFQARLKEEPSAARPLAVTPVAHPMAAQVAVAYSTVERMSAASASGKAADATDTTATTDAAMRVPVAANAPAFRWKMVAGIASMVAVAAIGWNLVGAPGASDRGQQLAAVPASPAIALTEAAAPAKALAGATGVAAAGPVAVADASVQTVPTHTAESPVNEPQVMIRDRRLDELMAAHKQFGGTSALQMPAGFLRNATFEAPAR
ncbi:MAG: hypothetical protein JWQ88_1573 [Rhodoferax sp.]|nr:hypothetical protein [Rhodoferax sp.]